MVKYKQISTEISDVYYSSYECQVNEHCQSFKSCLDIAAA